MKIILLLLISTISSANDFVNFFNKVENLTADFVQTVDGKSPSSGTLYFARPDSIKWHTQKPDEHILMLNNNIITSYDIWLQSANLVPYQPNELIEIFINKPTNKTNFKFIIKQNGEDFYGNETLLFAFKEGILSSIISTNNLNEEIKVTFTNLVINEKIDKKQFIINFPEDVDIFDESL